MTNIETFLYVPIIYWGAMYNLNRLFYKVLGVCVHSGKKWEYA